MNEHLRYAVKKEGYCCIYAYLRANALEKEIVLAAICHVTPRTIRTWRRKLREGTLSCSSASDCLIQRIGPLPDPLPPASPFPVQS
jgi:hypothetical protein